MIAVPPPFPRPRSSTALLAPLCCSAAVLAACAGLVESGVRAPQQVPGADPGPAADGSYVAALGATLGGFGVLMTVLLVAGAVATSVRAQRRDLAVLRAVAASPGQVQRIVRAQVLQCLLVVLVPGLLLGRLLGSAALSALTAHGAAPPGTSYRSGWIPLVATLGAVLLVAIAAARWATRPLVRARPAELLTAASTGRRWAGPWRVTTGLLLLGGGLALSVVTATVFEGNPLASATAGPAPIVWACGIAVLGPAVTALVTAPLRLLLPDRGCGVLRSAARRATASRVESAAVLVPVVMAVGTSLGIIGLNSSSAAVGAQGPASAWGENLLVFLVAGCSALHLLNALVEAASLRQWQNAALRTVGARPSWLVGVEAVHTGVLALCGAGLGVAVAASAVLPYQLALTGRTWVPGPASALWVVLALAVLLPLLLATVPAALAVRRPPVEHLATAR
ncbi:FtsX-like permease family protein [Kineococcus esterisolvens]|uniref:FtsX-like permease family protein n=1 Tax=unclassified Kineococcus TaxID=2621656 RepID=UPI003D7CAB46